MVNTNSYGQLIPLPPSPHTHMHIYCCKFDCIKCVVIVLSPPPPQLFSFPAVFREGDKGDSWYVILRGSVNVLIHGKGVVCSLHEGQEFGKLAVVNEAVR